MARNIPTSNSTASLPSIPSLSEVRFKLSFQNIIPAQFVTGRIHLVVGSPVSPGEVTLGAYNLVVDTGTSNMQLFLPDNNQLDGSEVRVFLKSSATGTLEVLDHSSVSLLTLSPGDRGSFVPFGGEWFFGPF